MGVHFVVSMAIDADFWYFGEGRIIGELNGSVEIKIANN